MNWYSPQVILPTVILTGSVFTLLYIYRRHFRRILNIASIPPEFLTRHRSIFGRVTSIGDADNFRFFHTPGGRWAGWEIFRPVPIARKDLQKAGGTLHIRLAGVDAPEGAHFGNPAQPYAKEAQNWLERYIGGRRVRVTLWARDRYERVVGSVHVWRWNGYRNVSLDMVKAGWATMYLQAGAEYGGIKETLERCERTARLQRKGMWKHGLRNYESPADYKKRHQVPLS